VLFHFPAPFFGGGGMNELQYYYGMTACGEDLISLQLIGKYEISEILKF
jgi:hypothetical protein